MGRRCRLDSKPKKLQGSGALRKGFGAFKKVDCLGLDSKMTTLIGEGLRCLEEGLGALEKVVAVAHRVP